MITFEQLGLQGPLLNAVATAGFTNPTPIQAEVIPKILEKCDVVAKAQTGSGKTAAFGLPSLSMVRPRKGVGLLVITPTRELAQQVGDELLSFGSSLGLKVVTVYGGQSINRQVDQIQRGAEIVVATPGRLLDILQSGRLSTFHPSIVVLDEADEMLDMGFLDDIKAIFGFLPEKRQTLLFSATMPAPIQRLAQEILHKPVFIDVTTDKSPHRDIEQIYCVVRNEEREEALVRLIDAHRPAKSVIFCATKKDVDHIAHLLGSAGHAARGLHGDMEQPQRQQVIKAFRDGGVSILVATDVAARGLNIVDVTHVFNFHLPWDGESYIHRIGRTGRAGRKGIAITLLTPREIRAAQAIAKRQGITPRIDEVPTLDQLKQMHVEQLIGDIQNYEVQPHAHNIYNVLQNRMDSKTLCLQLISMVASNKTWAGADIIGVALHEVEKMMQQGSSFKKEGPKRGNGKRPFEGFRGKKKGAKFFVEKRQRRKERT